jgi:uncharacterized protein
MQENMQLKYLTIHLDEEGKKIVASFVPEGNTDNIKLIDIRRVIDASGFGGYQLNESALQDATAKYTAGEPFEIVVGEAVDGEFKISIDTNQLNAYLTCMPACGGAAVTLEQILAKAERMEITVEVDRTAIENALKEGGENILIASGRVPVDGEDVKFENLIPDARERCPRLDDGSLADFRDLGNISVVYIGDALMRRIPPTSGEPGIMLSGKIIPAKPGKDQAFAAELDGTEFHPNDQDLLIAVIDGSPVLRENGVSVEPICNVQDVDLRTGNIDFHGTVNVGGDVHTGMTVKATGDIHVKGTVEGAILIADGDIVVNGGILGLTRQDKTFHSSITCKASCNANFVQNALISAGNGIFIRDFVMQSNLSAGHQIVVGDKGSRKGYIIGGVTNAGILVKAQIIGSPAHAKTVIIAGADEALLSRLTEIAEAKKAATNKLFQVVKLLELVRTNPDRIPADTAKAAEATRVVTNAEISALLKEEEEVNREIDAGKEAQIVAEQKFLEGAEICLGSTRQNFVVDREGGIFQLKDDQLVFS